MSQTPISVPVANLSKSPVNVRKRSDADADAQLEASILSHGIIQNLVGVPVARKKGHYRITAGGRRLDALQRLIGKGLLKPDHEVLVLVFADTKDGREISLAENRDRLAMSPAEECCAYRDIIEVEKKTPADVARRFGVEERFVIARLRLANLAQPIFDALAADAITLDVARAYCTTADTVRQIAVWEALQGFGRDNVNEIRRALVAYSYRASDPKALLIGRDAYLATGGRVEDTDLFSTQADERWIDTHIVDELADAKLAEQAEAIREREGYGAVRVVTAPRVPYTETYDLAPIANAQRELPPDLEARRHAVESELEALDAVRDDEGDEANADHDGRYAALQAELSTIVDRPVEIAPEQRASALAYVVLGVDGVPHVHPQLYAIPAPMDGDDASGDRDTDGDGGDDNDTVIETDGRPSGLDQRLRAMLATMKTELLGVHVASDPAFALDLGTFIMVDRACRYSHDEHASALAAAAPARLLADFKPDTPAAAEWSKLDEGLDRSWLRGAGVTARYDSFCALSDEARAAWLGWAIARTIQPVPDGHDGAGLLDHLGTKLGIDVASWWRPTALTYFDRLTKPAILALFEEIGGTDLSSRYAGSRKHDLAASAERVFAGDAIMDPEVKARAIAWLPEAMRFKSLIDTVQAVGEAGIAHHREEDAPCSSVDLPEAA